MGWIAPVLARDTRVCVDDRAGRGWSDPADGPQDAVQTTTDLHTLLDHAHTFPGPTCSPVTPSAACTSSPSPPPVPTRLPAWCCWTPPRPYPVWSRQPGRVVRLGRPNLRVVAGPSSPRGGPSDR